MTPDVKRLLRGESAWKQIPPARWFDLGLAAYLLAPEDRDYGWPRLSSRHAEATGLDPERPGLLAFSLHDDLKKRLAAADLERLLLTIEQPLTRVLADMEETGVCVDLAALDAFLQEVQHDLDQLTADIYEAAGGPFNIRSAQQMGEVLFKRLGLTAPKSTKGGRPLLRRTCWKNFPDAMPWWTECWSFASMRKCAPPILSLCPVMAGPGRAHSYHLQSDRHGYGASFLQQSQPSEYPRPGRHGAQNALLFHRRSGQDTGVCGLFPDRAARTGSLFAGSHAAGGLPQRRGYSHQNGGIA